MNCCTRLYRLVQLGCSSQAFAQGREVLGLVDFCDFCVIAIELLSECYTLFASANSANGRVHISTHRGHTGLNHYGGSRNLALLSPRTGYVIASPLLQVRLTGCHLK